MVFGALPIDQKRLHPRAVIASERQIVSADRRIGKRAGYDLGGVGLKPEPGLHLLSRETRWRRKTPSRRKFEIAVMLGEAQHQPIGACEPPGMAQRGGRGLVEMGLQALQGMSLMA
jgi:hypothetical protein